MKKLCAIFLIVLMRITYIKNDCGFPAIPVHTKIIPLNPVYFEEDSVEYVCEHNDMKLIGGQFRICLQSEWIGDIPQCVREIPGRSVELIEIGNNNHTVPETKTDEQQTSSHTFFANYHNNECIESHSLTDPANDLRIYFKQPVYSVNYVEIVVHISDSGSNYEKLIKNVYVNEYRECKQTELKRIDIKNNLIQAKFECELKSLNSNLDIREFYEFRLKDEANISVLFSVPDLTICQLHVYQYFVSHWSMCGSPDIPLHSEFYAVMSENDNPLKIGYKYVCEEWFELIGNMIVLCGLNTKWMDKFPKCMPKNTCELQSENFMELTGLKVEYKNLYSYDGNITAINGSQAIYSCADSEDRLLHVNRTLIGDSVLICSLNGEWIGEMPFCTDDVDLTISLAELNEKVLETQSILENFTHFMESEFDCGLPAIPAYSRIFMWNSSDMKSKYKNGSIIIYHCDSRFTLMANDFNTRQCVNGSWTGNIGKCYQQIGAEIVKLDNIYAYEKNSNRQEIFYVSDSNTTSEYWNYLERDADLCATFQIARNETHEWTINLSREVRASYFILLFSTTRLFTHIEDKSIRFHKLVAGDIISAKIHNFYNTINCTIANVIEVYEWITQISFKCDSDINNANIVIGENLYNAIELYINPDKFHANFNSSNIKLCGLAIFSSPNSCGTPEHVSNADMSVYSDGTVRYVCHNGYKLVGNTGVRCARNGKWMDQFPKCELFALCDIHVNHSSILQRKYFKTMVINNEEVAVLGTIVKFWCKNEDIMLGKHVLIGPRTVICASNGKWSANKPVCRDEKWFANKLQSNNASSSLLTPLLLTLLGVFVLIVGVLVFRLTMTRRLQLFEMLSRIINRRRARPQSLSPSFTSYSNQYNYDNNSAIN